jgi:hypothetical protein
VTGHGQDLIEEAEAFAPSGAAEEDESGEWDLVLPEDGTKPKSCNINMLRWNAATERIETIEETATSSFMMSNSPAV